MALASICNLGVIFDTNLTWISQRISAVYKSYFHNIPNFRCIPDIINQLPTACRTIISCFLCYSSLRSLSYITLFHSISLPIKLIVFNSSTISLFVNNKWDNSMYSFLSHLQRSPNWPTTWAPLFLVFIRSTGPLLFTVYSFYRSALLHCLFVLQVRSSSLFIRPYIDLPGFIWKCLTYFIILD